MQNIQVEFHHTRLMIIHCDLEILHFKSLWHDAFKWRFSNKTWWDIFFVMQKLVSAFSFILLMLSQSENASYFSFYFFFFLVGHLGRFPNIYRDWILNVHSFSISTKPIQESQSVPICTCHISCLKRRTFDCCLKFPLILYSY